MVPEDESELKKMTKIQRAIERLNKEIDCKALRGVQEVEDGDTSSIQSLSHQPAVASINRRHQLLAARSASMNPTMKNREDERVGNLKKRIQIERLQGVYRESDSISESSDQS